MRLTEYVHQKLQAQIKEGARGLDATCGNGHDTLFLAKKVGNTGHVWAFDIQAQAISQTSKRLEEERLLERVSLICDSHERIIWHLPRNCTIDVAMFNLGYLPGADKALTTQSETTVKAIRQAWSILKPDGALSIILYPGHPSGYEETQTVRKFLLSLPAQTRECSSQDKETAPQAWLLKKNASNAGINARAETSP